MTNLAFLKAAYFLLKEDYKGFADFWNSKAPESFGNSLNFSFIENSKTEKTIFIVDFNKQAGVINASVTIPSKTLHLLLEKYGLKIQAEKE